MRKSGTIILVDDVSLFLFTTTEILKNYHTVYIAKSAEALYSLLQTVTPDLIMLDINMPFTNGFDIIIKLKANMKYHQIPIIFVTAKQDKETIVKAMELGASDYIFKPFEAEDLLNRIDDQLSFKLSADKKARILVVDDNASILTSISNMLQDVYEVYVLPKPEDIKRLLKRVSPDLFILDYKMPVLTGFELVPIIRSTPGHEETPILFLTSESTPDIVLSAIDLGAKDFICKPIDEIILREKIAVNLEDYLQKRLVRELLAR